MISFSAGTTVTALKEGREIAAACAAPGPGPTEIAMYDSPDGWVLRDAHQHRSISEPDALTDNQRRRTPVTLWMSSMSPRAAAGSCANEAGGVSQEKPSSSCHSQ